MKNAGAVFIKKGVIVSIKGYEVTIDICEDPHSIVNKINSVIHKTSMMQKTIDILMQYKFIIPAYDSPYNANIVMQ